MALGVNAHVNNDIPQALLDAGAKQAYYEDYKAVNRIIAGALDEVLISLQPARSWPDPGNAVVRPVYKPAMSILIRRWRADAWKMSQRLRKHQLAINELESKAQAKTRLVGLL
jgi:hypothetical protein